MFYQFSCHLISINHQTTVICKCKIHSYENTTTYFKKHSDEMTTTNLYSYIVKSVFYSTFLCFNKICSFPWHWIVKFFQDVRCYTIPRFTYAFHISSFTWHLVTDLFLHHIRNVLYGIYIWRIPRPFQNGYSFTFLECSSIFI